MREGASLEPFSRVPLNHRLSPADRNLNDAAYRTIKDDIISCALQAGKDISVGVLAARYRLGKAPIRSATMRLRQEGLVVSRGRQGNAVSTVTLRDVQEIFQLRLVLAVTAVHLAAGRDVSHLGDEERVRRPEFPIGNLVLPCCGIPCSIPDREQSCQHEP